MSADHSLPPGAGWPVAAVLAVVPRGEEVCLVRRTNRPDSGLWGYPGGKIEPGEAVLDAAARELHEETGITARPERVLTALDIIRPGFHYVLIAVACRWDAGEPVADTDVDEAAWVPVTDIRAARLPMSDRVVTVLDLL